MADCAYFAETEEEGSMQSPNKQQDNTQDSASNKPGRMYKYRRWLGYWNASLDNVRTETELALHVSTSAAVQTMSGCTTTAV